MKTLIAKHLLKINAVFLSPNKPFTWASGIKSPIYCDNRLTLSYPDIRVDIEKGLAEIIKTKYPECEIIMGTATAGIPHAALVADILHLPMGYVRSQSKAHGRNNQIEGKYHENEKVVVIEDLFSTGGSSIEVVEVLRENGFDVLGIVSIFTYNLDIAFKNFANAKINHDSLTDYDTIIQVALEENLINKNDLNKLAAWKKDPTNDLWMEK